MKTYLSFSVADALSFEIGRYWFHGYAFGRGLYLCAERRLAGEPWTWIDRGEIATTGRLGPFSFTADRRLPY
jgi:hypothetical protein